MKQLSKEQFIFAIEKLEEQTKIDEKNYEAFKTLLPNSEITEQENVLYYAIIGLLESLMDDKDSWIKYYLWDLNFGDENYRLKVYGTDKKEIPLRSAEDLWNLLTKGLAIK